MCGTRKQSPVLAVDLSVHIVILPAVSHTLLLAINSLQTVLGIILGGGAGTRLYPLTKKRAKPAVPLGANYRLIDIPVSNCVNSNVTKIYCLTQFNSASLNRHLSQAYVSDHNSARCTLRSDLLCCSFWYVQTTANLHLS